GEAIHPKGKKPQSPRTRPGGFPPVPCPRAQKRLCKRGIDILFVLREPPSERLPLDSLEKLSRRISSFVVFDQRSQGYKVSHTKSHESENRQKEQRGHSARQIALSYKEKREQAKQENNASDRLAKKRGDKQDATNPGNRNSEDRSHQAASPE